MGIDKEVEEVLKIYSNLRFIEVADKNKAFLARPRHGKFEDAKESQSRES